MFECEHWSGKRKAEVIDIRYLIVMAISLLSFLGFHYRIHMGVVALNSTIGPNFNGCGIKEKPVYYVKRRVY